MFASGPIIVGPNIYKAQPPIVFTVAESASIYTCRTQVSSGGVIRSGKQRHSL